MVFLWSRSLIDTPALLTQMETLPANLCSAIGKTAEK